ncbi:hydroxymethylbilane synthase [Halogranum rubrum]|uniref:Hydroxymethylbilane synthase n=1 Tax=Halogranum rubrum TaxID=553466 RepID=A0A1I4HGJ1_9EURY|nr:hydroxymethylbilane synthase [Halogranum rubrum]SFL41325.1 hydroxymethylbilane synthase [Halogranum rubrum]
MNRGTLRIATRGSDLALRQAASVQEALESYRYEVEIQEVETRGDQLQDELIHQLGKTGAFVRNVDQRVLDGDANLAVHSMKDMPTDQPPELTIAGIPERASAFDVLVSPDGYEFEDLPVGSTVGTSSLRRKAQILNARPDLTVEPLRGNVDTRIQKLLAASLQAEHEKRLEASKDKKGNAGDEDYEADYDQSVEEWFDSLSELQRGALEHDLDTEYDAIVLAEAGLRRSGLHHHVEFERLPRAKFVPAPGQGAIAVTAADPDVVEAVHTAVDHPRSRVETTVERTVLEELGGGCVAPIGVHAILQGSYVHTEVQVLSQDGEELVESKRDLPVDDHANAAIEMAESLRDRGAADLIKSAKRDTPSEGTRDE